MTTHVILKEGRHHFVARLKEVGQALRITGFKHKGEITVDSKVGEWTTFTIKILVNPESEEELNK